MNRSPAFQFYPDKALAGTIHLSDKAFKAYWRLVWFMWLHSDDFCSISGDRKAIMVGTGLNSRLYQSVWVDEIMNPAHPMFRVENNRIVCNGLRKEAEKQAKTSEVRRQAAFAKHLQAQKDAIALQKVVSLTTTTTPTPAVAVKEKGVQSPPASLPEPPEPDGDCLEEDDPVQKPKPVNLDMTAITMIMGQIKDKSKGEITPAQARQWAVDHLPFYDSGLLSKTIAGMTQLNKPWEIDKILKAPPANSEAAKHTAASEAHRDADKRAARANEPPPPPHPAMVKLREMVKAGVKELTAVDGGTKWLVGNCREWGQTGFYCYRNEGGKRIPKPVDWDRVEQFQEFVVQGATA